MATIYGYARCSTNEELQDIDRQRRELLEMGVSDTQHIYAEYISGTKEDRPELKKLLSVVDEGDTIVATEVSRLSRSTRQLCEIIQLVRDKKLRLILGSFVVDCRTEEIDPMTKGMLMLLGVFSEMERDMISQRVKSGMRNAAAKGKKIGRPKLSVTSVPNKFIKYYKMYKGGQISISEIARLMGCTRATVYRYISFMESASRSPKKNTQKS